MYLCLCRNTGDVDLASQVTVDKPHKVNIVSGEDGTLSRNGRFCQSSCFCPYFVIKIDLNCCFSTNINKSMRADKYVANSI